MNPYTVLGIKPGEDPQVIRRRYRLLAGRWHPDRNPDAPLEAERKFKEIAAAYQELSRDAYSSSWAAQTPRYSKPYPYKKKRKSYWERMREDEDNPASQAKVVLYELSEGNAREGMRRYLSFREAGVTTLDQCLEGRDFLDCSFLLAEEFERKKEFDQALKHYRNVFWQQHRKPIMAFFRIETRERLVALMNKMAGKEIDAQKKLALLKESIHFSKGKTELKRLMVSLSNEALTLGDVVLASKTARGLFRKGYSIKSLSVVKAGHVIEAELAKAS
jgi:curved DNA-binding protein CbpA